MKNILFLHSSAEMYGSDRSLLNLVKHLDKNLFKVTVILPENGVLVEELKKINNVEVIIKDIATLRRKYLSLKGIAIYSVGFVKSLVFLISLIKTKNINVVYTNTSVVFPGGIAAKILRRKSIWHIREIIENKIENTIISAFVNFFSDTIITNSKATGAAISKNSKKLRVIYNAIESQPDISSSENKVFKQKIVVGMAGRINRWKGQRLFVDMAENVLKYQKDVEFVIAGDAYFGENYLEEDLKSYIISKNLGTSITLLGHVKDMNSFYESIDIFVLPSTQPEPFGLVILEAMERGIPVVATNHGGPVEIIDDREDGFLVDYKVANEMGEIVLKLVIDSDLRKKVGKKGKEKRRKIFSIENYVSNISNIIEKI